MTAWAGERRADVIVLTAIPLEFEAVLDVEAGAVPGSSWDKLSGPSGLPLAFRSFAVDTGRPLRVAAALAPAMGPTAATHTLVPLVEELKPRCVAMCGVCAGRRGKTQLGDVVVADRLFYRDTGKQLPDGVLQDLTTYQLRDDWKTALETMDVVARFRDAAWFRTRPLTAQWREGRVLAALRNGVARPWSQVDATLDPHGSRALVASLRARGLLARTGRELTPAGHRLVDDLQFEHGDQLPDLSPSGAFQPFRLHVAPLASGTQAVEDEAVWAFISPAMRKTLGLDMEGAVLGELAHRQRQHAIDAVVMKGVMDFADPDRDDHFKAFAARASAECLLAFLRERIPTERQAGFDDLLTPGTSSVPARSLPPSSLLLARHTVVPWHDAGRAAILAELDAWADDPARDVAVQLIHAAGGVGKTRLAIEWVRRRRGRHDVAGFLVPRPDERWLERLCGLGPSVLVVIDYAERRADLVELLERVAAYAAGVGPRRRLRILLLARSDGDWWAAVQRHSAVIDALLHDVAPITLSALADSARDREAVYREASAVFAAVRGRDVVPRSPIALEGPGFDRVLYLHMAALAAVEGAALAALGAVSGAVFDAGSLMDVILDHEERFWIRQAGSRHAVAVYVPLARQLMAAATLRGALATQDDARQLCAHLAGRLRTDNDDAMIALLHDVYARTAEPAFLPGLEPDLLGEAMVLRVAQPPRGAGVAAGDAWIDRVFTDGDDEAALLTGFIVLGRASVIAAPAVGPWIQTLLDTELSTRAVIALRAAKTIGQHSALSVLGDLLADALERRDSAVIAVDLDREQIPYPTVSLQRVATWRSQRLHKTAPGGDDAAAMSERAAALAQAGLDLDAAGKRDRALAAAQQAVTLYGILAAQNADEFQPPLARSLNNLGNSLSDLGQREEAITRLREAVALCRGLVSRAADAFEPDLAMSLNNLGTVLHALEQHDEALAVLREAVELYRRLAERNPDAFQAGLAMSLNNLGVEWGKLGQHDDARRATHQAVQIYQKLAKHNSDAFQPDYTKSLSNLGIRLSSLGRHDPALAVTQKAVNLYRKLAERHPDAFQAVLANSLNNLGLRLGDLRQPHQAQNATREAVGYYRVLAAQSAEAFQPALAMSLSNLGKQSADLGQKDKALEATQEAVNLYSALSIRDPDAPKRATGESRNGLRLTLSFGERTSALATPRRPTSVRSITSTGLRRHNAFQHQLAQSLTQLSSRLGDVGQHDAALAITREALSTYRWLAIWKPETFQPDLARSLNHLGKVLGGRGQHEEALATTSEAVELWRKLVARNPDAFGADFAKSVTHLSRRLSDAGQQDGALAATREAVDAYRQLAASQPEAFELELARSLNDLGNRLSGLGQRDAALVATREAVELCRMLVARSPDAFEPDLAQSLNNLGNRLSSARQHDEALAATHDAVGYYRTLADRNSDAFRPELASSLNILGIRLSDKRQREPALAATREAVEHYRALVIRNPREFQPALAAALNNLGAVWSDLGQRDAALEATREAVDLRRALASRSPDGFQPLAASLCNLGNRLSDLQRWDAALEATREAADLYRMLAASNPDGFEPELARTLCNLVSRLRDLGQRSAASTVMREALDLCSALAIRNPDAFRSVLAQSLSHLGIQLN